MLGPRKSQGSPTKLSPSVKRQLNTAGLDTRGLSLGVAGDLEVLLHCAQTTRLCWEGAGGLRYVPSPQLMALSEQLCVVSHPFSGWTVMARGLSSPCEMTT